MAYKENERESIKSEVESSAVQIQQNDQENRLGNLIADDKGSFLKWRYKFNESKGAYVFESLGLADGKEDAESLRSAIVKTSGTSDPILAERIIRYIAQGMSSDSTPDRLNDASAMLAALNPKDETEAMLLGQFLALQDSGMKCLRNANSQDMFYHIERLFSLATKLFNTANQTMQAALKYRSGGHQTVQVIHVHNEGQAIVAQNVSSTPLAGSGGRKL
jgi:hypothetical protein